MSYSLNSLKGVREGIIQGSSIGDIKGDTRSLDYSSYDSLNPRQRLKNKPSLREPPFCRDRDQGRFLRAVKCNECPYVGVQA